MKKLLATSAFALLSLTQAQAADFNFTGNIATHKDVVSIDFTLATDATNVKVWTNSFLGGVNFDPITAVWAQNGSVWNLVGENDDDASIDPGQTNWDSGLTFASLDAGNYRFTIATYNNFANGTTLSDGFLFDNEAPIALADWDQPANHVNMGTFYSVNLSGVDAATNVSAVPEPETLAMLLAGLGLVGAIARRRRAQAA